MIGRLARWVAEQKAPVDSPPEDALRLGEQAKRLLEDPVLNAAFAAVERNLRDTWAASASHDTAGRERVFATLEGLQRAKGELHRMVGNSKLIAAEIARKEREKPQH